MKTSPIKLVGRANPNPDFPRSPWSSRRTLQLLVGFTGIVLVVLSVFFVRYLLNPRPIQELISPELSLDNPPHYLGSIYNLNRPIGVAVSNDGTRIYVSESDGERLVRVFDRGGQEIGSLAPMSTQSGERAPVYLAVSPEEYILVTDRNRHVVSVYASDGTLQTEYDPGWSPLGVRFSPEGALMVTDVSTSRNCVRQLIFNVSPQGNQNSSLFEIGPTLGETGAGPGQLNFPNSAVRDTQGRTYISDGNNWRISVWDQNGNFLFHFGAGAGVEAVDLPRGLFIDRRQRLYVVDTSAHKIKVYDLTGSAPEFLFAFGDLGTGDEHFQFPTDIAIDQSGRIYITDRENNRVQIWTY